MSRRTWLNLSALVAVAVVTASPASGLTATDICSKRLTEQMQILANQKWLLLHNCVKKVEQCEELSTPLLIAGCVGPTMVANGVCSAAKLDVSNPASNLSARISQFQVSTNQKCKPSDQGGVATNPDFDHVANAATGALLDNNFSKAAFASVWKARCSALGFTTAQTTWTGATGLQSCLARIALQAGGQRMADTARGPLRRSSKWAGRRCWVIRRPWRPTPPSRSGSTLVDPRLT